MNDQMYVVIVDTRAMSCHDIDGYTEHRCSHHFFDEHVIRKPRSKCIKSKVAEMCGVEMKLYFNDYIHYHAKTLEDPPEIAITNEQRDLAPKNVINGAATLLTFDPRTGFPEYKILGPAYVVIDSGDYPVSSHQVWGIQDLISEARDLYYCDPDHLHRGRRHLLRWCIAYRHQEWGPMTIYEPRLEPETLGIPSVESRDVEQETRIHIKEVHEYYSHRHFPNCACRRCKYARRSTMNHYRGISSPCASGISGSSGTDHDSNGIMEETRNQATPIPRRWALFSRGICNTE